MAKNKKVRRKKASKSKTPVSPGGTVITGISNTNINAGSIVGYATADVADDEDYHEILLNPEHRDKLSYVREIKGVDTHVYVNGLRMIEGNSNDYELINGRVLFHSEPQAGSTVLVDRHYPNGVVKQEIIKYTNGSTHNQEVVLNYLKESSGHKRKTSKKKLRQLVLDNFKDNLKAIEIIEEFGLQEE